MKRLFTQILSICIAVIMAVSVAAPLQVSAAKAGNTSSSVFYYQRDPDWGYGRAGYSACYISSFAMILTNMGYKNADPGDVYRVNGYSTYTIQSRIANAYGVSWNRYSVSGRSTSSKIELAKKLLKQNPQGIIVRNRSHTMVATGITKNGNIIFNDPAYPNGGQLGISRTQHGSWSVISYLEVIS